MLSVWTHGEMSCQSCQTSLTSSAMFLVGELAAKSSQFRASYCPLMLVEVWRVVQKRPLDMRLKVGSFLERKGHSSQGSLISFVKTTGKCPSQAGLWHAVWLCGRGRCKDKIQHLPRRVHSPHPWVLLLEVMPPSNSLDQVLKETRDSAQAGSLTLNTLSGVLLTHFPENTHETHSSPDTDLACWVKWLLYGLHLSASLTYSSKLKSQHILQVNILIVFFFFEGSIKTTHPFFYPREIMYCPVFFFLWQWL